MALLKVAENLISVHTLPWCVTMSRLHWVPPHMKQHPGEKTMIAPALGSWGDWAVAPSQVKGRRTLTAALEASSTHTQGDIYPWSDFGTIAEPQMPTFFSQGTGRTATKPHRLFVCLFSSGTSHRINSSYRLFFSVPSSSITLFFSPLISRPSLSPSPVHGVLPLCN